MLLLKGFLLGGSSMKKAARLESQELKVTASSHQDV
jgi:hypothetical protein